MQFSSSLKFNHVFRRLYNKGDSCANRYLVVYCRRNGSKRNRIGLTVGAKLGHAVERNRLRRRLREIYRLHEGQFARGYDIVVVARTAAMQAPYRQLEGAYLRLAGKARHLCAGSMRGDEGHMKRVLLGLIRFYQRFISPGLPRRCRFSPTCSQYAFEAIEKYGALKGGWLAFKRLMRCNPFYKGDYFDPVP